MLEFNINEFVKVKLTPLGIGILKQQHDELNKFVNGSLGDFKINIDEDGYYKIQLWQLIETFGGFVGMAKPLPFENKIMICD